MAVISEELAKKIQKEPDKTFRLLIVIDKSCNPDELPFPYDDRWMGNILLAHLRGSEVSKLTGLECIRSIEEDGKVSAM